MSAVLCSCWQAVAALVPPASIVREYPEYEILAKAEYPEYEIPVAGDPSEVEERGLSLTSCQVLVANELESPSVPEECSLDSEVAFELVSVVTSSPHLFLL